MSFSSYPSRVTSSSTNPSRVNPRGGGGFLFLFLASSTFFLMPFYELLGRAVLSDSPMVIGTMTDQDRCIPHIEIIYGIGFPVHPFDTLLKLDVLQLGRLGEFFHLTGEGYLSLLCDGMSIFDLDPFGLRNESLPILGRRNFPTRICLIGSCLE